MSNIPRCEHPRPDLKRDLILNLNGEWEFEIDNECSGLEKRYYERTGFDGKINVPFCPESRLSGIGHTDFMNAVWYRRDVEIPEEWDGKRIILHIDAADYETHAFVNGKRVGMHRGGYTSFKFDISAYLTKGKNSICIYCRDDIRSENQVSGKQSHRFASYGCYYTRTTGIWQTVWLEAVGRAYVDGYKAYPNISEPSVSLDVKTNADAIGATLKVTASYGGRCVGETSAKIASESTRVTLSLSEKHLWEPGRGELYDLSFELLKDGCADTVSGYFGLREIRLSKEHGLQINGRTVFGRFVLDQGFYPDGITTAPSDEALIFDIEASIKCGFNGARLHQKVFEPRFLYHADRLGYMVWAETGNWGLDHTLDESIYNFLPEWLEEIERDFSHPSIIGWCPFNETWDKNGRQQSRRFLDTVYDVTRAIDKTRPVITTSGSFPTERTDVHDVHEYEQDPKIFNSYFDEIENGIIKDQLYRADPRRQRYNTALPVFVSEYGGIKWVLNEDATAWGYGKSVKTEDEFFTRLEGLTDVLLENKHVFAFCYTQLTDIEQEQNGILTYDRRFKFAPEKFARIFSKKSVIEE